MKPLTDIWERLIGLWDNWGWEDTTTAVAHLAGSTLVWLGLWCGWSWIKSSGPTEAYYIEAAEHTIATTVYCVKAQREWAQNRTIACFPTQATALVVTDERNQTLHATR